MTPEHQARMFRLSRLQCGLLAAVAIVTFSACEAAHPLAANDSRPETVTLTTDSSALLTSLGDTAFVWSQVQDRSGTPLEGVPLRWTTDPAGVVEVDGEGVFRAVGNGRVTVVAEIDLARTGAHPSGYWAEGLADSIVLEVRQRPARLEMAPVDSAFTTVGAERQLRVQVTDARGNALLEGPPPLTWGSADPNVLTVDSAGVVRSNGEGDAQVTVRAGSLLAAMMFTVRPHLPHTSCMVFALRRQTERSCVTLELTMRQREDDQ